MRRARAIFIYICAAVLVGGCATHHGALRPRWPEIAVIPKPAQMKRLGGAFIVHDGMRIIAPSNNDARRIAHDLANLIERTRGLRLEVVTGKVALRPDNAIVLVLKADSGTSNPEGYTLDVQPRGSVISARDPRGLFYGAVTLWQLLTQRAQSGNRISVPALHIVDEPQLPWRGFMLDVARHYMLPEFIKQLLDWMALHKLNTLHWHLTDDQGWRLQIVKYPRLTEVGALGVTGGYYSQDEVRDIVRYAAERFITVVPEIEMPGHAQAAIAAYPRLGTEGPTPEVSKDWGVHNYLFNVDEETFQFLQDVLVEVMSLFPSRYIHVGGDEAVKERWHASARVQQRMHELGVANEAALQGYFIRRIERFLNDHDRRLMGWDEILEDDLPPRAAVMSWRGSNSAVEAARQGHDVVLAQAPDLYLDYLQSDLPDEPPGRLRYVTLADVYAFNPLPQGLNDSQRQHILGAQLNAWTEHMRVPARVEHNAFPKVAALAEVTWTPAAQRNWESFLQRLPAQFARYRALGIEYSNAVFSAPRVVPENVLQRSSDELKSCSNKLPLRLEDDAPLVGERAIFNIDILDPCWIFPHADLSRIVGIAAAVGQLPFNFQVGDDVRRIPLHPPQTRAGELEVHIDGCNGERVAVLPLAAAVGNPAVTDLPGVSIAPRKGQHDLCLYFTRSTLEPMWALAWVRLLE